MSSSEGPIVGETMEIRRGEDLSIQFLVEGGAGISDAAFHMASSRIAGSGEHDIDLASPAAIDIATVGPDATLTLNLSRVQTEALLFTGRRYFEIAATIAGRRQVVTEGIATVLDTLL